MSSWRYGRPKQLKKVVYSMTESTLLKLIEVHESRGWIKEGDVKKHGYGLGCLMVWGKENICQDLK
ncbi:hypothetical protein RCG19_15950 [Neobacillus sp. OS1-2]|uniref:hypothetical protein n=1 Tax=Neobacillus sp. OS1-2 TaxID=3070680 RepID=UPI0027E15667|nr:hypothetical protein [Neobacillus sp. OS1-2]WML38681.1 hypothetical protein RCG19_15950 [Neobacillus sp. OS1-2]